MCVFIEHWECRIKITRSLCTESFQSEQNGRNTHRSNDTAFDLGDLLSHYPVSAFVRISCNNCESVLRIVIAGDNRAHWFVRHGCSFHSNENQISLSLRVRCSQTTFTLKCQNLIYTNSFQGCCWRSNFFVRLLLLSQSSVTDFVRHSKWLLFLWQPITTFFH